MQYLALATDYDGTLAHHGHVDELTLQSCRRLRASGRKLILVTGRELPELQKTFPEYEICDLIVAENGGLLYCPATGAEEALAEPPPPEFAAEIQARGLTPCSFGRVIVATWQPHEGAILELIRQLGLEYQIIFNKGAVMVLPSGVNKATGLAHALARLGLTGEQVVGIGDAENDHAFLDACAVAVAVENALPALKQHCDLVTSGDHGRGVQELVERLLADDLQGLGARRPRRGVSAITHKTP
jgi:hydroxymethylpyrimidine pyrophosphatase-like HAD family hydrolase